MKYIQQMVCVLMLMLLGVPAGAAEEVGAS